MKRTIILPLAICFLFQMEGISQFDHVNVLKGLEGQPLFEKLVEDYKPEIRFTYGEARDTLYSLVDVLPGNRLEGIYSGFTITLDPNDDPTTDAFQKGINAEHTYPQSKGAGSGPGRSDMHHLRPSKVNVNADRGSFPFGESTDTETDLWYRNDQILDRIPPSDVDSFSELHQSTSSPVFEPREQVKGDIARGIFYFYTMYREEAMNADPAFFELQREVLCDWHFQDPVDESEWNRNQLIAPYQDNKLNPFILDCSLASRLYCDNIDAACELLTPTQEIDFEGVAISQAFPNPTIDEINVILRSQQSHQVTCELFSEEGAIYTTTQLATGGQQELISLPTPQNKGVYIIKITLDNQNVLFRKFTRI